VVFKDVTHKKFYYRVYIDMTLRSIEMDKLDFSENAARLKMPLLDTPYSMDVTTRFLQSNKTP
jgi:choloylglycine hydrolase